MSVESTPAEHAYAYNNFIRVLDLDPGRVLESPDPIDSFFNLLGEHFSPFTATRIALDIVGEDVEQQLPRITEFIRGIGRDVRPRPAMSIESFVPDNMDVDVEEKINPLNAPPPPISVSSSQSNRTADIIAQARQNAVQRRAQAVADQARIREAKAQDAQENAVPIALMQMQNAVSSKPYDWKKRYIALVKKQRKQEWTSVNRSDALHKYKRKIWRSKVARARLRRPRVIYKRSTRYRRKYKAYNRRYSKRRRFY